MIACHTNTAMGGLRVDSREGLLKGGKSGPAIVPNDPEKSLLVQAVRQTSDKLKMPLGGKLKPAEIETLVSWIREGAVPSCPPPVAPPIASPSLGGSKYSVGEML